MINRFALVHGEMARSRGATALESLVASLIVVVGIMGLMNTWIYSYRLTEHTKEVSDGYNIARAGLERFRALGHDFNMTAPLPEYYDGNALYLGTAPSSSDVYRLDLAVARESAVSGLLDHNRLMHVEAVVIKLSDSSEVYRTQSLMGTGGL